MALGRRKREQQQVWIATTDLPKSPGHPFYQALNRLLDEADFDRFVEDLCEPHYADGVGRPGIPPGVYFRMLLAGYFEGIGAQRAIAWRCSDSLSLRAFLGLGPTEASPDHSSLTVIRQRLPFEVHEQVFTWVLAIAHQKKLLKGKTIAVDATTLEANAAMKSIVRKATGEDWKAYVKRLAEEAGLENPTEEDLRRFDKKRPKKVSNKEWESRTDPDSRIAKMKDGRTHLAYKAEHAIDLDTEFILAATIHPADRSDAETLGESTATAQANLVLAGSPQAIQESVADKGYHKAEALAECRGWAIRTYIPERRFAHTCETGGARRTWIRGLVDIGKRYLITAAAHNLGLILRAMFGIGTARSLQGSLRLLQTAYLVIRSHVRRLWALWAVSADRLADLRLPRRVPQTLPLAA